MLEEFYKDPTFIGSESIPSFRFVKAGSYLSNKFVTQTQLFYYLKWHFAVDYLKYGLHLIAQCILYKHLAFSSLQVYTVQGSQVSNVFISLYATHLYTLININFHYVRTLKVYSLTSHSRLAFSVLLLYQNPRWRTQLSVL